MTDYNEPIDDAGHVVGDGLVQRIKDLETKIVLQETALDDLCVSLNEARAESGELSRQRDELKAQVKRLTYELERRKEVDANKPNWEKLWEEQSKKAEALEAQVKRLTYELKRWKEVGRAGRARQGRAAWQDKRKGISVEQHMAGEMDDLPDLPEKPLRKDANGNDIPWAEEHDYFMGFDPNNPDLPTD